MAFIICIIFIVTTVVLLSGHGSILIAGYNTLSKEEKKRYDKKKLSRQTGVLMLFIDIPLIICTILDYQGKMKDSYGWIVAAYIVLVVIVFMVFQNRKR